ncbi:unnamed protein product [Heligmosomoides polygyrus]|uniref:Uncharacterized protein n=1 Tax=Heligmosomoides polygyrus TaxID=6339 RepID=A0A3P7THD9_HELPZ|nr:unnamed protein product [Heligmosomoides polygyrus]
MPYETVATQHRPLSEDHTSERCGSGRIKWLQPKEKEAAVIPRIADGDNCRQSLEGCYRCENSGCTLRTWHNEAWTTLGRQVCMAMD